MRILYDLEASQPNSSGKAHGGGKYAIAVFFELLRQGADMECFYDSSRELRADVEQAVKDHGVRLHDISAVELQEVVDKGNFDLLYSAAMNWKRTLPSGVRKLCTLHGLRELEMPRDWGLLRYKSSVYQMVKTAITLSFYKSWRRVLIKRYLRRLLDPEVNFITVSSHTKYSCMAFFPHLSSDRLRVFYSPSSVKESQPVAYTSDYKYVLLVSGNRSEKNALRALMALDEIFSERKEYASLRVLVTGSSGGEYFYRFRNPERFSFLGYVDESTLNNLYCGAHLFVYPSLNEGFGYPPLEAMRFGVPVVAAATTSISEVCGDAALYCNPLDVKEIKTRILHLLDDAQARSVYSEKGLERYRFIKDKQDADLRDFVSFILSPSSQRAR